jgi:putative Mg2+ transporter-C (MgtC) family protein
MNLLVEELSRGMPDGRELERVILRLTMASLAGAIIGLQRQRAHKAAGLRTHMLVSLGAAIFVIVPAQTGMESADLSRIIQGLATGIGFLGGGAILKLAREGEIHGLTTAAGIWLTAGLGVAVGLGALGIALITLGLGWIILAVLVVIESKMQGSAPPPPE